MQLPALYAFIYGLTFFAQNFGANSTTYIIPSLLFPLEHRATCHGISAAAGKFGALLGAQVQLLCFHTFACNLLTLIVVLVFSCRCFWTWWAPSALVEPALPTRQPGR